MLQKFLPTKKLERTIVISNVQSPIKNAFKVFKNSICLFKSGFARAKSMKKQEIATIITAQKVIVNIIILLYRIAATSAAKTKTTSINFPTNLSEHQSHRKMLGRK